MSETERQIRAEESDQTLTYAFDAVSSAIRNLIDDPDRRIRAADLFSSRHAQATHYDTLSMLGGLFQLSDFDKAVLIICAGVEYYANLASDCAIANGDAKLPAPTIGMLLRLFSDGYWSVLNPEMPLRRWRLIEREPGRSMVTSPLRIDERVFGYLFGDSFMDPRLEGIVEKLQIHDDLPPSQQSLARRAASCLAKAEHRAAPVVQLCGMNTEAKTPIATMACALAGSELFRMSSSDIPVLSHDRAALSRLVLRELMLSDAALLLECVNERPSEQEISSITHFIDGLPARILFASRDPLRLPRRINLRLDVTKPTPGEQLGIWRKVVGVRDSACEDMLARLAGRFDLDSTAIETACLAASEQDSRRAISIGRLWSACRVQARQRLDGLAERIESEVGFDDLVLPARQLELIRSFMAQIRHSHVVHQDWGFARKNSRGRGATAVFAGPSGTGKTLAAEVIANELQLDLYRIDLSQIISKYIGETEKNLQRVFEAAEASAAILLFDEADALFGKRSEVKDSHDRYANCEISYLLQRMENYPGAGILTTNQKNALDTAFLRRLRFVVNFPFPDACQRADIWRAAIPPETPAEALDFNRLARLSLPGGNIRSIALNAAFLAVDDNSPLTMRHIMQAAHAEYAKLERPITSAEFGGAA